MIPTAKGFFVQIVGDACMQDRAAPEDLSQQTSIEIRRIIDRRATTAEEQEGSLPRLVLRWREMGKNVRNLRHHARIIKILCQNDYDALEVVGVS